MFNLFKGEKTVNDRVSDLQNESMGIIQSFSNMIEQIKMVNTKIESDKQQALSERNMLDSTISALEKQQAQNEAIKAKIENIIS